MAADQKIVDCNNLQPPPIPPLSQQLVNTLPPKMPGETDWGYRDRLSDHDKGIYDWFQHAVGQGKRFQVYCGSV